MNSEDLQFVANYTERRHRISTNNVIANKPLSLESGGAGCYAVPHLQIETYRGIDSLQLSKILVAGTVACMGLISGPALAAIPADPAGSGAIVDAVNWLQGTLLGTVATVAAVIAVAAVGFMMLTGRINWRHGAAVILGCFILFGAASIVAGIRSAAGGG